MKNTRLITVVSFFAVIAALLFSGCSNALSPFPSQSGGNSGNVTVSFSPEMAGRAVLPSALSFNLYEFTFTNDGAGFEEFFSVENGAGGSFTFSLPPGSGYVLNVNAYKGTGEGKILAAAGGSEPFTVNTSGSTPVTVLLTGNLSGGENGTFSYTIRYPNGAAVERMALVRGAGGDEIDLLNDADETFTTITNSVEVPAGWHWLEADLSYGNGVAYVDDIVEIYSDTVTYYGTALAPIVFTGADFTDTSGNVGVRVYEWNGFDIEGQNGLQLPSMAVGTLYDVFRDDDGNTWTNVLKLEPPEGGYEYDTMAMAYSITEPGDYEFSFDVWAVEGDGPIDIRWTESTYPMEIKEYLDAPQNTWFRNTVTYTHDSDTPCEIGIWVNSRYWEGKGLRNATLYFKDFAFDFNGEPIVDDGNVRVTPNDFSLVEGLTRTLTSNRAVDWSIEPAGVATIEGAVDGMSAVVTAVSYGTATITAVSRENPEKSATVTVKVITEGSRYIAISFDDGPNGTYTSSFMNILESRDSFGTFFCIGGNTDGNPSLALEMVSRGHEIGNHSYNHQYLGSDALCMQSVTSIYDELLQTQNAIYSATGTMPVVFRAPALLYSKYPDDLYAEKQYGENLEEACRQLGLALIDTTDHQRGNYDWDGRPASAIIETAKTLAKDWGILLLHDSSDRTEDALPVILDWLHDEGYTVMTVSQLAAKRKAASGLSPAADLEPGRIYYNMIEMPDHVASITVYDGDSEVPAEGITLSTEERTANLTAVISPEAASVQTLYWYSDNESIVTVNNGTVTAVGSSTNNRTTTVRAAAGGQRTIVKVTVTGTDPGTEPEPFDTITSWDDFKFPISDMYNWNGALQYHASGAEAEILNDYRPGDGFSYENVLKLSPPPGGNYGDNGLPSMVFAIELPYDGKYSLSMEANVQTNEPVDIRWYYCPYNNGESWIEYTRFDNSVFDGDPWLLVDDIVVNYAKENSVLGLLAVNYDGSKSLKNNTIYIRNLKLVYLGEYGDDPEVYIINIPSTATEAVDPGTNGGITLKWAENGSLIEADAVTVRRGETVTITAPPDLTEYEWHVGRDVFRGPESTHRTFVFDSTGRALGTYSIGFYSGIAGGDAIKITVIN